jgi:probable phosphoglycerate mutase
VVVAADRDPHRGAPGIVFLVRHGRTALNAEGRLRGHLDPPLDRTGEDEVAALAAAFAGLANPPRLVVAGPLARTRQTARAIADACGLEVHVDARLIDRDYGPWSGEPADELRKRFGEALADLPDAEPVPAVIERGRQVLDEQRPALARGSVVLVAHDVVNSFLLSSLDQEGGGRRGSPVPQRTAAWNAIAPTVDGWEVVVENGDAEALRGFGPRAGS